MIDRSRFQSVSEINRQKMEDKALSSTLHLLHAAVPIEKLTRSNEWNAYLELIEGMIETEQKRIEEMQKKLNDPNVVNIDQIMLLKANLAKSLGALGAYMQVRDMPQQIVGAAERARGDSHG